MACSVSWERIKRQLGTWERPYLAGAESEESLHSQLSGLPTPPLRTAPWDTPFPSCSSIAENRSACSDPAMDTPTAVPLPFLLGSCSIHAHSSSLLTCCSCGNSERVSASFVAVETESQYQLQVSFNSTLFSTRPTLGSCSSPGCMSAAEANRPTVTVS